MQGIKITANKCPEPKKFQHCLSAIQTYIAKSLSFARVLLNFVLVPHAMSDRNFC